MTTRATGRVTRIMAMTTRASIATSNPRMKQQQLQVSRQSLQHLLSSSSPEVAACGASLSTPRPSVNTTQIQETCKFTVNVNVNVKN